jgi:NAD(P)-dependent dehydrogenase (short-subunit alcohol dehydrogenase family)
MLTNKVIIVTGGAGLLGSVFVKGIVKNHGVAIVADLDEVRGRSIIDELKKDLGSGRVAYEKLNIISKDSIKEMIESVSKQFGKIDALVNNAYPRNGNYGKKFEDVAFDDFCENVDMHLGGYFLVSQQIAAYFKKLGKGNIVNIASIYGVIAPRFEVYEQTSMTMPVEYAVIKSAIIHLTKYMARYLQGSNIRVNSISPGGILDKQDIVGTLVYLLSDMSLYINGQNIIIDDGYTV